MPRKERTSEYIKKRTEKITLETESYLVEGKENERFFPFLELEFNEDVIYENDVPKYYLSFSEDLKSAYGIGKWIMTELEKNNHEKDAKCRNNEKCKKLTKMK